VVLLSRSVSIFNVYSPRIEASLRVGQVMCQSNPLNGRNLRFGRLLIRQEILTFRKNQREFVVGPAAKKRRKASELGARSNSIGVKVVWLKLG
jgi:hypothetical protein